MMDGRVKTLHPRVHGGLLGRRGIDDAVMQAQGIHPIDLLVVNLYPFEEMSGSDLPLDQLIEYIDVGGPAMIRAAAKNYRDVAVVVDPGDYPLVEKAVLSGAFTDTERIMLARKAFSRTAAYDAAISNYLNTAGKEFPDIYHRPVSEWSSPQVWGEPSSDRCCLRKQWYRFCGTIPGKTDVLQ